MKSKLTRGLTLAALAAAALVAPAQPAVADSFFILPAGTACEFNLGFQSTGGNLHTKEFTDANGDTVRLLTAGKGVLLTYTNYGTKPKKPVAGESITIRTDGSVAETVVNPDGTLTVTATGHNGLIMFPSDEPAGPTTTHYIGKIVYNIDPNTGVFTLVSTSGQSLDICAELAS
ncbi:hypothetical protein QFZ40_002904 [Arthrobacter pascens]|uniref:hypothetical protein n=1 Tax=Arthrobacter pascens TaxID=1677 RepID=UPI002780DB43|nr:hypothetical protein [Arthrobacter pascens]MDQ0634995.1 hypothetical protein [Arthrobacter pascens]